MKMCLALCFVLPSFGLFAQKGIEKFPVFDACEAASAPIMEQCFYQTLYAQLRTNYEHPQELYATIADKRATLRFEVSKKGSFDLIHIDAMNPAVKVAMDASFKKLPVIQAPSYNGSPSFMQFVLTVPVPMSDDGAFQLSSNTTADNQ